MVFGESFQLSIHLDVVVAVSTIPVRRHCNGGTARYAAEILSATQLIPIAG